MLTAGDANAERRSRAQRFIELPNGKQARIGAEMGVDRLHNDGLICEKIKRLLPNTLSIHLEPPCRK